MPEGVWSHPSRAEAARASSFVWLLDLLSFPMLIVEDVLGIADASDEMLYVDTC
jgi:hypothetical protein